MADYFTKPLQGSKFNRFRNWILNLKSANHSGDPQECVGASTSKNASPIYRDSNNAMNHPRDSNDVMNHPSMEKVTSLYDAPLSTNDNNHNGFTGDKRSDDKLENARSYLSVAKSGMVNKSHFIHQTSLISLK